MYSTKSIIHLQFPKYHFDTQREFTITFRNAFTYELLDASETQEKDKTNAIEITFREDLLEYDDCISLRLTYDEKQHSDTKIDDEIASPTHARRQSKLDQIFGIN